LKTKIFTTILKELPTVRFLNGKPIETLITPDPDRQQRQTPRDVLDPNLQRRPTHAIPEEEGKKKNVDKRKIPPNLSKLIKLQEDMIMYPS
jgi:hypothetical protein